MKKKVKDTDIYIKPDIKDYGIISFDNGQEIIRKGEEEAEKVIETFRRFSDGDLKPIPPTNKI